MESYKKLIITITPTLLLCAITFVILMLYIKKVIEFNSVNIRKTAIFGSILILGCLGITFFLLNSLKSSEKAVQAQDLPSHSPGQLVAGNGERSEQENGNETVEDAAATREDEPELYVGESSLPSVVSLSAGDEDPGLLSSNPIESLVVQNNLSGKKDMLLAEILGCDDDISNIKNKIAKSLLRHKDIVDKLKVELKSNDESRSFYTRLNTLLKDEEDCQKLVEEYKILFENYLQYIERLSSGTIKLDVEVFDSLRNQLFNASNAVVQKYQPFISARSLLNFSKVDLSDKACELYEQYEEISDIVRESYNDLMNNLSKLCSLKGELYDLFDASMERKEITKAHKMLHGDVITNPFSMDGKDRGL